MTTLIYKIYSFIIVSIILTHLTACASDPPSLTTVDNCSAPELKFMTVTTDYNRDDVINLAGAFSASIKADAENIKLLDSGEASASLTPKFTTTVHKAQKTGASVSQEFFQEAMRYRTAVCNTERYIKEGTIKDPDTLKDAQEKLLNYSDIFLNIKNEEEKKNIER